MSRSTLLTLTAILIFLTAVIGCARGDSGSTAPVSPVSTVPRNVLLITLDTTRADSLGCYGHLSVATPALDELANEGLRVENAYASAPMTLPSHSSMLTGQYPFTHGVRNNTHYTLSRDNAALAEILQDAGWSTAAFIGSTVLLGQLGLDQGFDEYHDDMYSGIERSEYSTPWASRKAVNVNYDVFNWLDSLPSQNENDKGWFAWVHYFDPHFAYNPPEPFYTEYSYDLYLGEIAYMDSELGRLLTRLKELDLYDNTLIIAVGDHGEGLGEHNEVFHALWTYDSTLKVPFIISAPCMRGNSGVIEGPASVIDVFPTILGWCGVEAPIGPGLDLLSADVQSNLDDRLVYFESMESRISFNWAPLRGVIRQNDKYIHTPIPEIYDLASDPGELTNICDANPELERDLKTSMYRLADEWRGDIETGPRTLSAEDIARLESLGYITGGAVPASDAELEDFTGLSDLKSMADMVDDVSILREQGDSAFDAGDYETAREKYIELLKYSEIYTAVQNLGMIAAFEGNQDEAVRLLRRAVELAPAIPLSWYNLAVAYRNFGMHREAIQAFEQAVIISPNDPVNIQTYVALAVYLSQAGNWSDALTYILQARDIDNKDRGLIGYEASIRYQLGKISEDDSKTFADTLRGENAAADDPRVEQYNGLVSSAESMYRQAYELYGNFLSTGEGTVSHYYEAGQCAIRMRDYQKALDWTRSAINLLPAGDTNRTGLEQIAAELERIISEQGE